MFSVNVLYEGKHILLVEDQLVTAMVESNAIIKSGFRLTHVKSGEEALEYMRSGSHVDLILMDIDMGDGISGIDAAQEILSFCDVPLMFLSGHTEMSVIAKTESVTSYGYVLKDGNVFVLLAAIRMAIRLHSARSLYRQTYDNSMNGIVIHKLISSDSYTPVFSFFDVNPSYEVHSGLHRDDVLGKSITEVFGESEAVRTLQLEYREILRSGTPVSKRLYFEPTKRWFDLTIFPLTHEYLSVVMNNITDSVAASEKLRESLDQQRIIQMQLIKALCHLVESRDPYTAGHQERTAEIAALIAGKLQMSSSAAEAVRMAALVHDIGKISIPSEYLTKPSTLTKLEFELIKSHSLAGYTVLKDVHFEHPIAQIVLQHHEREDGSGYPNGLTADNILLEAKIVGVADVIESMSSHRPYRPKLGLEAAISELSEFRGEKYNSEIVDICCELYYSGELQYLL